jgi:hypothetical protein
MFEHLGASSYTGYSMNAVSIEAEEAWKHKQNWDLKDSIAESPACYVAAVG